MSGTPFSREYQGSWADRITLPEVLGVAAVVAGALLLAACGYLVWAVTS